MSEDISGSDRLRQLYERFRTALNDPYVTEYFDEQDLVDVFDYAGDVRDEYIRLEVLLQGSRMFPQSDDLLKRRAIWLAGIDEQSFKAFVADNKHNYDPTDPMWEIFRLRREAPSGPDAIEALEQFITNRRLEEDEAVIQFVALVRQLQQEAWLIDNLDRVRNICGYDQTLLFEIARLAETNSQVELSIKLLEELTMIDPFNPDYWGLLAELQANIGRFADAEASLDYAKALTPDDPEFLTLEGYVRIKAERYDAAIESLGRAIEIDASYYPARRNLLDAYIGRGDAAKASPLAVELQLIDRADPTLLCAVLIYAPLYADNALAAFYAATGPDESAAVQRAGELCMEDHPRAALTLLQWYDTNFTLSQSGMFALLDTLYICGEYSEAYRFIIDRIKSPLLKPHELPIISVVVSTLVRLRIFDEAIAFCDTWIEKLSDEAFRSSPYRLMNRGLLAFLSDVRAVLTRTPAASDDEIARAIL